MSQALAKKCLGARVCNTEEAEIDGFLRFENYPSLAASVSSRFIEKPHLEKQDEIEKGTCY